MRRETTSRRIRPSPGSPPLSAPGIALLSRKTWPPRVHPAGAAFFAPTNLGGRGMKHPRAYRRRRLPRRDDAGRRTRGRKMPRLRRRPPLPRKGRVLRDEQEPAQRGGGVGEPGRLRLQGLRGVLRQAAHREPDGQAARRQARARFGSHLEGRGGQNGGARLRPAVPQNHLCPTRRSPGGRGWKRWTRPWTTCAGASATTASFGVRRRGAPTRWSWTPSATTPSTLSASSIGEVIEHERR